MLSKEVRHRSWYYWGCLEEDTAAIGAVNTANLLATERMDGTALEQVVDKYSNSSTEEDSHSSSYCSLSKASQFNR